MCDDTATFGRIYTDDVLANVVEAELELLLDPKLVSFPSDALSFAVGVGGVLELGRSGQILKETMSRGRPR
jgi:hypothetical protein